MKQEDALTEFLDHSVAKELGKGVGTDNMTIVLI